MEINVRNKNTYSGEGEFIGRPSALENPFRITKNTSRESAISMYAQYITDAIMNEGFASVHHEEIISELNSYDVPGYKVIKTEKEIKEEKIKNSFNFSNKEFEI